MGKINERRQREIEAQFQTTAHSYTQLWGRQRIAEKKKSKRKIYVILKWFIKGSNSNGKINKTHDAE